MFISSLTNFIEKYIHKDLLYTISKDLLKEDIIDEADRGGIIEKVIEFGEKNTYNENNYEGVGKLFDNYNYNISITIGVVLLISISCYFSNILGLFILSTLIITLFGIPFFISIYLKRNIRKLFCCLKNIKTLIKNDYLKLLKRREVLLFAFKNSELNNLPNKKLRNSCLISLRKLVWMLILKNKNEFKYQEKSRIMMIDLINENMLELCGNENNIFEVNNEYLDTMSLSTLLQFLSLCESEFLSFMFFEIYEILNIKSRNSTVWKCWWDIWRICSIINHVILTYEKEFSLLSHLFMETNKFDFSKTENKVKVPVITAEIKNNKTIVNDLIELLSEEVNQLEEDKIIGNKTLLEMARNLYNFLDNTSEKKIEIKKEKIELKTEIINKNPTIIENKVEPTYEVYENNPSVDNEEYFPVNDIPEIDKDIINQHKMLLNELERPLRKQREMHEEIENNILAKKRGITVNELKEILKNEQEKEEEKRKPIISEEVNNSINSLAKEHNISLMEELQKQYFSNKTFVNDEIIFGDSD
uniref:Vezatin n=1 Tax=Strongyloides stercoralis TaxID=6248 RepID=A0A0K0E962_STRER